MFEENFLQDIRILSVPDFLLGWPVGGLKIYQSRQNAFIFTVVTAGADTFQLPIYNGGTYDFMVRWGDGSSSHITAYDDAAANHSYTGAGTYTVSITGIINGWRFNNAGDKTLIHDISSWGPLLLGNSNGYFYGCTNLTVSATDILDVSSLTTFYYAFYGCSSLTTLDVSSWNVSSVTTFHAVFCLCSSLTTLDVSSWDVSSVTTFHAAFSGCSSLTTLDVSSWNVAAVADLSYVFCNCSSLTTLDVSSWNVSSVTTFSHAFRICSSLTTLDVSSWNVSSVTTFSHAFRDCSSLTTLDVSSWNVAAVADFSYAFYNTGITASAADNWDITAVTNMTGMFQNVTLATADYDAILISWEGQVEQANVVFHAGDAQYSAGAPATARAALVDPVGSAWTITDGGQVA